MVTEVIMFKEEANLESVTTTLQYNIAQSHLSKNEYLQSILWFQNVLSDCLDPLTSFKALHNIGYCTYRIGNMESSMQYFQLAFPMLSKLGLSCSSLAAVTSNCLGVLYFKMNTPQLQAAMKMFQRSLRIYHFNERSSPIEIATLLNNIGRVFFLQSKFDKAKDVYYQSLQLRRHHLGSDSIDVAAGSFNLGTTYHKLMRLDKAMKYFKEFLTIGERKLGLKTHEVALAYKYIAEIYQEKKEPEPALQHYEKSLVAAKSAMGYYGHREVGSILNRAGNLCFEYGKFDEALKYYLAGLEFERNHPAWDDALSAITLTNIAHVYKQQGKNEAALEAYEQAYNLQKCCSRSSSGNEIASTLSSIGFMQYHLKNYDRALEAYQEALRIRRECMGSDVHQASTLNSIGLVLFKKAKFEMSKASFFECLQIRRRLYGSNHKDVAIVWYNLASVAFETRDDDSALKWYEEALRVERVSLGDGHPDVGAALVHLGQVKQECGFLDQALDTFLEALRIKRKYARQDKLGEARLINLIGNCFLQQADVRNMMEAFSSASRLLFENGCENDFIHIVGYNRYWLSKLCPECAPVA